MKEAEIDLTRKQVDRFRQSANALKSIRKDFEWLKKNGIQFVEPIHKTYDEIELELNRRYKDESKYSQDANSFMAGAMWASNNE